MNGIFNTSWARGVSLGTALLMMVLITVFPRGLTATGGSPINHGILALIMWGLSAGFVHGIGFVPHNSVLRALLGAVVAWLGMSVGLVFYIRYFLR